MIKSLIVLLRTDELRSAISDSPAADCRFSQLSRSFGSSLMRFSIAKVSRYSAACAVIVQLTPLSIPSF